jgi:hypothetical protein
MRALAMHHDRALLDQVNAALTGERMIVADQGAVHRLADEEQDDEVEGR